MDETCFYALARLNWELNATIKAQLSLETEVQQLSTLIDSTDGNIAPLIHEKELLVERVTALGVRIDDLIEAFYDAESQLVREEGSTHLCSRWIFPELEFHDCRIL